MAVNRRTMLAACAAFAPALAAARAVLAGEAAGPGGLGLVIHSFPVRIAAERAAGRGRFAEPGRFLDHARSLGATAIQVGLGALPDAEADALRDRAGTAGIALEGIASLPRDAADADRFAAELRTARRAGAEIVRTVTLSGRRYETFDSAEAFRRFADEARHRLGLAAPIAARQGVRLAVENHKDWRADELLDLLDWVESGGDHLGVCLDTGNSMALLEDPMEVVETLAPRALTTHLKDMGVEEHPEGFLLAEVPLGAGVLDIPRVAATLRAANPAIRLNLEMITRDPLRVPCLAERYWATFPDLPARHLARALAFVRDHPPTHPLPRISTLEPAEALRAEDANVARSLAFGRERLGA